LSPAPERRPLAGSPESLDADVRAPLARVELIMGAELGSDACRRLIATYSDVVMDKAAVLGSRSFSQTTPPWLTTKVLTPVTSYSAGAATREEPRGAAPATSLEGVRYPLFWSIAVTSAMKSRRVTFSRPL
jgi:hypothetical protein